MQTMFISNSFKNSGNVQELLIDVTYEGYKKLTCEDEKFRMTSVGVFSSYTADNSEEYDIVPMRADHIRWMIEESNTFSYLPTPYSSCTM